MATELSGLARGLAANFFYNQLVKQQFRSAQALQPQDGTPVPSLSRLQAELSELAQLHRTG